MSSIPWTREKSRDTSQLRTRTIVDNNGSTEAEFIYRLDTLETKGVDIPGFRKMQKQGKLLPMTPFEQVAQKGSSQMNWTLSTTGYNQTCDWSPLWMAYIDILDVRSKLHAADALPYVQAAAAKIYSSGWDGLTFILELKKTVQMFRDLLKKIDKARSLDDLSSEYLEARYGWRVVYYDMLDIVDILYGIESELERRKERVGTTRKWTEFTSESYNLGSVADLTITHINDYTLDLRGTVVADIKPPEIVFNPILTGWELLTFSFVIDWVIQVGQYLEALSFLALSDDYTAASGKRLEVKRTSLITDVSFVSSWWGEVSGNGGFTTILQERRPTTIPLIPSLNLDLSFLQVADLVALFVQTIRR